MKKILSIDGGGIRGIIPAVVMRRIEKQTGERLYNLFDMIVGTSTGGILAAGVGSGFTSEEMLGFYVNDGEKIFERSFFKGLWGLVDERYPAEPLEDLLNKYFGGYTLAQSLTRVMITSYDIANKKPFMFKSWKEKHRDVSLKCVARATSAAPTYFEPTIVRVGNESIICIDGGVKANNPAMCAYAEAKKLWSGEEIMILSLGTGKEVKTVNTFDDVKNLGISWVGHLIEMMMDGTEVDYFMKTLLGDNYARLQAKLDIASSAMDDASRENIEALIREGKEVIANNEEPLSQIGEIG